MATQTTTRSDPCQEEIVDPLSNQRRCYAIHYCKREDKVITLDDLTEHVAAWGLDRDIEEITFAERKQIYTSLQQTHLPVYVVRNRRIQFDGMERLS